MTPMQDHALQWSEADVALAWGVLAPAAEQYAACCLLSQAAYPVPVKTRVSAICAGLRLG
jgi:hypothetical protein